MVMVEDLLNDIQFLQVWSTIDDHFNVTNPNLMRSMTMDRLNNVRYNQSRRSLRDARRSSSIALWNGAEGAA